MALRSILGQFLWGLAIEINGGLCVLCFVSVLCGDCSYTDKSYTERTIHFVVTNKVRVCGNQYIISPDIVNDLICICGDQLFSI